MIQYIIAAGIGAFLGSRSKKSKKSYAEGGSVDEYEFNKIDNRIYENEEIIEALKRRKKLLLRTPEEVKSDLEGRYGQYATRSHNFAKGGKTKVKYDYIPKEAIDELSYTMDKVSKRVSGSNVLSGAYVKSASKVKAKTKGSSDLTAKILAMMTDGEGNKKVILSTDVKEMQKYVSDKLITAFYLGLPKAYDFKGDYSYSGGLVNYEEDYAKKIVVDALKNIKANKFEMGLKYPQYNFEKLLGKPIIKDIEGKSIKFSSSTRTYTYRLWIWKDCVIGQTIGMTDSKDGYSDYTYGEEPTLMGGYKSVQTSKASKLESIAKFMAKDKDGYVKDNDVLYNGLGGANFDALDKNKINYEKGGSTYAEGGSVDGKMSEAEKIKYAKDSMRRRGLLLQVEDRVKDLSDEEYEVFAYDNNVDLEDANEMEEFIWTLSEEDAKKIIKQLRGSYKKGGKTRKNRKK